MYPKGFCMPRGRLSLPKQNNWMQEINLKMQETEISNHFSPETKNFQTSFIFIEPKACQSKKSERKATREVEQQMLK